MTLTTGLRISTARTRIDEHPAAGKWISPFPPTLKLPLPQSDWDPCETTDAPLAIPAFSSQCDCLDDVPRVSDTDHPRKKCVHIGCDYDLDIAEFPLIRSTIRRPIDLDYTIHKVTVVTVFVRPVQGRGTKLGPDRGGTIAVSL